jgi:hypothetical protein
VLIVAGIPSSEQLILFFAEADVPDITQIPEALRKSVLLPLRPGTKTPAVKHAVLDAGQQWSPDADAFLALGGQRLGIFMAGIYVVLDADLKMAWEDDGAGGQEYVVTRNGNDDVARLMEAAGMTELPRTVKIRTQGGGTHWYFLQNPECKVSQKRIGYLDVRSAPNAYCAIGAGYELLDDGAGVVATMPLALAHVLQSTPADILEQASQNGHREGAYGNALTAFNNALTTVKGRMVELGWPEEQANEAIRKLNEVSDDPMPNDRLEGTVLQIKGWTPGEQVTDDVLIWAQKQVGLSPEDEDNKFLDPGTVKRLWTTDRYRQAQNLIALEPPPRERMADVISEPPPSWIIDNLMSAGLYGLAGPQEAGKSLLVRDWADVVANGRDWNGYRATAQREVSYVISEGHFDLDQRFIGISMDRLFIYRDPVMLNNDAAVDHFLRQHEGTDIGLVIFDIIYHMGVGDDNTMKDVKPVLQAGRRISRALNCAVLVVGHPGHNKSRRFRGSSIWRNWFDGEFHMSDGVISCEKHKYARKESMEWSYEIDWPRITFLSAAGVLSREARKMRIIDEIGEHPTESARSLAARLAPVFDASEITVRRMILDVKKMISD